MKLSSFLGLIFFSSTLFAQIDLQGDVGYYEGGHTDLGAQATAVIYRGADFEWTGGLRAGTNGAETYLGPISELRVYPDGSVVPHVRAGVNLVGEQEIALGAAIRASDRMHVGAELSITPDRNCSALNQSGGKIFLRTRLPRIGGKQQPYKLYRWRKILGQLKRDWTIKPRYT